MLLDDATIETVLERMANGEILTALCAEVGCTPSAFSKRADRDPDGFGQRYARARQFQADAVAEDVVRIADDEPDPQKARVRCDARKWLAGKLNPAKFGDKTADVNVNISLDSLVARSLSLEAPTIEHVALPQKPSNDGDK